MSEWWWMLIALSCILVITGVFLFMCAMVRLAKEADEQRHEAFLKEVEKIKEEHKNE